MYDHTFTSKSPDQTSGHTLSELSAWWMHTASFIFLRGLFGYVWVYMITLSRLSVLVRYSKHITQVLYAVSLSHSDVIFSCSSRYPLLVHRQWQYRIASLPDTSKHGITLMTGYSSINIYYAHWIGEVSDGSMTKTSVSGKWNTLLMIQQM